MSADPSTQDAFEANRLSWDERVETHWASDMYQAHVRDLRAGGHCLKDDAVRSLGDVTGRSLVHLQCHMGMETLSWASLGADVCGLDFSQPAIDKAELLRDELNLKGQFVCANVYDAVEAIGRTFDIVFVSVGAICWLPDLDRWARVVADMLEPGGRLYMDEVHPFLDVFDDHDAEPGIAIKYPYLDAPPQVFDTPGSYAAPDATFENNRTYYFQHAIGTTLNALIKTGMVIDRFDEYTRCVWPRFKVMKKVDEDTWSFPEAVLNQLPNVYTLEAHKDTSSG